MPKVAPLLSQSAPRGDRVDVGLVALDHLDADDEARKLAAKSLLEYSVDIPEPGVGELRMEDFPFHREWYSAEVADAREIVLRKSAQVGASAFSWRYIARRVDQFGDTGIYIFPTERHVSEFGDERIEPAIQESEYLRSRIAPKYVKTKHLKRIGRGFLHMKGSNSKAGAQSVPAQVLVFDEYDLLDATNLPQIERRLSGAVQIGKRPRTVRLGYPYKPGDGIDAAYAASDQRVWHVTCRACGEEQPIEWAENFRWTMPGSDVVYRPGADYEAEETGGIFNRKIVGEVWRQCRACEASLEDSAPGMKDGALREGRWIKQNPESKIIGFYAWRGMVPVTDLEALVVSSRGTTEAEREAFFVLDLGQPYKSGESSLDLPTLLRACSFGIGLALERYDGPNPTTMGVDVGDAKGIHVTIDEQLPPEVEGALNPRQSLWIGRCRTWQEVAEKMELFRVHMTAIDMNPERRWVRLLRATFPGRVVGVEFEWNITAKPWDVTSDPLGVPEKVRVYRTDAIDGMMDAVRQVRWRPLRRPPPGWLEEMQTLRRVTELDRKLRPVRRYETTGGADDYPMSATYGLIATELWRLSVGVAEQLAAAAGTHVPDEEIGFTRVNLGAGGADVYDPGFGGE